MTARIKSWQRVYITGGGSGIGLCLAKMMVAQGADVAIFDLKISGEVKHELLKAKVHSSQEFSFQEIDIRDAEAVTYSVNQAATEIGKPDLALNVAGVLVAQPFEDLSAEAFERVIAINLFGSRNFAAAVLPLLSHGGQMAFVASLAGLVSNYAYSAYCASKFGVVALAGVLRQEYAVKGINVSVICPGEIDTPMVADELKTMHPVTKELKSLSGHISVEVACTKIIKQLKKGHYLIIPGAMAKLTYWLHRISPMWLFNKIIDNLIKNTLNKMA